MASPQIIWDVLRHQDSTVIRRDGVAFARDRKNLSGKVGFAHSGLAQARTVGVVLRRVKVDGKSRRQIDLAVTSKEVNHPKAATTYTKLSQSPAKAAEAINAAVAGYRPDLRRAALARYSALKKSLGVKKAATPRRSNRKE